MTDDCTLPGCPKCAANRADQRDHRGMTHWEGCWDAGPRHYECLRRRVASQPPVTDGPTLVEVARQRDTALDRVEQSLALVTVLTGERDEARAIAARLREAVACDPDEHATYLAQRDEARAECEAAEAQADAERQRRKSAEATRDAAIAERDALQRRLDALATREPTTEELRWLHSVTGGNNALDAWRFVRDALLAEPSRPTEDRS